MSHICFVTGWLHAAGILSRPCLGHGTHTFYLAEGTKSVLLVPQVHEAPVNTHSTSSNPSVSDLAPSWTPDSNISDITQCIVFLNSEFSTQGFFFFSFQRMKCDAPVTSLSSLHLHSENLILTYIFPRKCHCFCEIWAPFLYREQCLDWMS